MNQQVRTQGVNTVLMIFWIYINHDSYIYICNIMDSLLPKNTDNTYSGRRKMLDAVLLSSDICRHYIFLV